MTDRRSEKADDGAKEAGESARSAPTINDIARLAGVSKKSVSRVINNERGLSEETREHIKTIMQQEGYVPSRRARALAGSRSFLIGLVYNNANPSFIVDLLEGVQRVANEHGFEIVMHQVQSAETETRDDIVRFMRRSGCDGVILTPPLSESVELIGVFEDEPWRVTRIAGDDIRSKTPQVRYDDRSAAFSMTQHIIANGHREIGFLGGPKETGATQRRMAGFKDALLANKVSLHSNYFYWGDFTFPSGLEIGRSIFASSKYPTAIVCANDAMAAGMMQAARETGLEIPGDISVTGFDDSPLAVQVWPPLSSVAQPVRAMAEKACELLLDAFNGDPTDEALCEFQHELKERQSVGLLSAEPDG